MTRFQLRLCVVTFFCVGAPLQAAGPVITPFITLGLGQAADVWSTRSAIGRGCVEANTTYRMESPSVRRLVTTKVLMVGPTMAAMYVFNRTGHPKIAKFLGYGGGAVGGGIATWNLSIQCGH